MPLNTRSLQVAVDVLTFLVHLSCHEAYGIIEIQD
jgi:hypothetical protein